MFLQEGGAVFDSDRWCERSEKLDKICKFNCIRYLNEVIFDIEGFQPVILTKISKNFYH